MAIDSRVSDLLLRWRELQQQGKSVAPEVLCADAPELLAEFQRYLRIVEGMEHWLSQGAPSTTPPPGNGGWATVAGVALAQPVTTDPESANGEPPYQPPAFTIPGYELLGVLGQGGMGIVYKAKQTRLKRLVALKMIRSDLNVKPQQLARFRQEAEAVAQLTHPHIVQIYEVGESDGRPFFCMEWVDGGSLAQRMAGKPMAPYPAAELLATIAEAIHFAHQRGVVHRDLKPANVLLTRGLKDSGPHPGGEPTDPASSSKDTKEIAAGPQAGPLVPKIADFGLAKILNSDSALSGLAHPTQSGIILGTPSYMAPEQAQGKTSEIGPLVDVYALGAILYELLTGRAPFVGATPLDTLLRVVSSQPPAPSLVQPGIPRDLETICLKCLEKFPGHRYSSAAALAQDLRRFGQGLPITARSVSKAARLLKWARRRPDVAALLSVLILALLTLTVVMGFQYRDSQRAAARLAPRAREILYRYCFDCHGRDPSHLQGDLPILDYDYLVNKSDLVIPRDVHESRLIHRIEDNSMPPEEEEEYPRLSSAELEDLKKWVAGGAPRFLDPSGDPLPPAEGPSPASAIAVKEIFQAKCRECHRFGNTKNGIKILNHDLLVNKRKVIIPHRPDQSTLYQLLITTDQKKAMPPVTDEQLTQEEVDAIRLWIAEGAPAFPRTAAGKK